MKNRFQDKFDFIIENIKDKIVLDIGCVEEMRDFSKLNMKKTQHYKLKQYTKRLVGIDLEKEGVESLNAIGCECYVSFAENVVKLNLGKFDVILIGDIIEHIPDPSLFLKSIRENLTDDGIIICTTPNIYGYHFTYSLLLKKPITRLQHVAGYCWVTLSNLFRLSGYDVVLYKYGVFWKNPKNKLRPFFEKIIFSVNEEFAPHLLFIAKKNLHFNEVKQKELQEQRIFTK